MCKLLFVGDITININVSATDLVDESVQNIISEHDITCCNFEGPIMHYDAKKEDKVGPNLIQNEEAAAVVENIGFNLISLANNHIMDYGINGLRATINAFSRAITVGASISADDVYMPFIKNVNGVKIGFIMVAENGFGCANKQIKSGYAWMLSEKIIPLIKELRSNTDIVIVNCHAGAEHWEHPLPEVRDLYKNWIDCGADLIIGHHPHIVQGWEKYNKKYIFYSLGNFIFNPVIGKRYDHTIGVSISIINNIIYPKILYFNCNSIGKLCIDMDRNFAHQLSELCLQLEDNEQYMKYIDDKVKLDFKTIYQSYFNRVNGLYDNTIKGIIKSFIRRIILGQKFSIKWLFHTLSIETHLWVVRRALSDYSSEEGELYEESTID
jgi:poly-gamma-glutamate synthesis protein (capsule biosynthesis protein)